MKGLEILLFAYFICDLLFVKTEFLETVLSKNTYKVVQVSKVPIMATIDTNNTNESFLNDTLKLSRNEVRRGSMLYVSELGSLL